MIRTQTHKYVKLENKISQEHATETVQIDQEKIHHDFTTLHTNKGPQHARSTAAVDDNKLTDNAKPERTFCTKTFRFKGYFTLDDRAAYFSNKIFLRENEERSVRTDDL